MPKQPQSPETRLRALEKRVKALEEQNERLLERLGEVERRASALIMAKLDDPRFPYSNWLLKHVDTEEKHARVHAVLHVLTSRVMGESPKNVERLRLGLPPGLANGQGPPTKGEILDALKYATGIERDDTITDMIQALYEERLYTGFCQYAIELFDLRG